MNWLEQIEYFHPLQEHELSLFAPPRDVYRAQSSYNHALERWVQGELEEAAQAMEHLNRDFPMFAQAAHLHGIFLAIAGKYAEAEEQLKKTALLDLSDAEYNLLEEQLRFLEPECRKIRREQQKRQRREELLLPIRAEQAMRSILSKAPKHLGVKGETGSEGAQYSAELRQERLKTIRLLIYATAASVLVLLLFFLVLRPQISKRQQVELERSRRLNWLESELLERAGREEAVAALIADYQAWIQAGCVSPTEEE